MGEVISNNNITFEEMNCKSDMVLDIFIEKLSLRSNVDDKILIDNIFHDNSSLIGKKCLNKQSNEILFLKDFFTYGDYIVAHAEGLITKSLMYINCNLITLIDESNSKRTRVKTNRYYDMIFNSSPKNSSKKNIIPILECFSEDSSVTVEYEDGKETIIIKDSDSNLNLSILRFFHIYVGEFKLNHENQRMIDKTLSTTMLLNIISVNFNSNMNIQI